MKRLSVLVACEFSGVVRRAFHDLGHEAFSCDILESEDHSQYHLQSDAVAAIRSGLLGKPWDLVICHPPCQYLANSGVRWLYDKDGSHAESRWDSMHRGARFFVDCWEACELSGVGAWAFENPIMHKHAKAAIQALHRRIPLPSFFQPWEHGHPESKKTGLYLYNLPALKPSADALAEFKALKYGDRSRVHYASPGPNRWKERSRTLPGVAKALAKQFSNHLTLPEAGAS